MATKPNAHNQIDVIGPLSQAASSNARYILPNVDSNSRFTVAKTLTSCADNQILEGLILIKRHSRRHAIEASNGQGNRNAK